MSTPTEIAAALEALTSGPHPMTLQPGADSTEPAPQPQGTYDASVEPDPTVPTPGQPGQS